MYLAGGDSNLQDVVYASNQWLMSGPVSPIAIIYVFWGKGMGVGLGLPVNCVENLCFLSLQL